MDLLLLNLICKHKTEFTVFINSTFRLIFCVSFANNKEKEIFQHKVFVLIGNGYIISIKTTKLCLMFLAYTIIESSVG